MIRYTKIVLFKYACYIQTLNVVYTTPSLYTLNFSDTQNLHYAAPSFSTLYPNHFPNLDYTKIK